MEGISIYKLLAILGGIAAAVLAQFSLERSGIKRLEGLLLSLASAASFLVFARLWNFLIYSRSYGENFKIYSLRFAGFSLYGGLLGVMLLLFCYSRLRGKRLRRLLDCYTLAGAVAFCIARLGCFLNGCCYGKPTDSWVGYTFPQREVSLGRLGGVFEGITLNSPRYPTQLFEMAGALLGILLLFIFFGGKQKSKDPTRDGLIFYFYAAWLSLVRLVVLPFRELSYSWFVIYIVYPLLYIAVIFFCTRALFRTLRRSRRIGGESRLGGSGPWLKAKKRR